MDNSTIIFAALFAVSEVVGLMPNVKSSSVFQLIIAALKKLAGR